MLILMPSPRKKTGLVNVAPKRIFKYNFYYKAKKLSCNSVSVLSKIHSTFLTLTKKGASAQLFKNQGIMSFILPSYLKIWP